MDIAAVIQKSLDHAVQLPDEGVSPGGRHRSRSKHLVESLASNLRDEFSGQPAIRVFSKHYTDNRKEFGMNELLFDILVCETGKAPSATGVAELTYVSKALWAIESEMALDSREALYDFNKLVLASSDNKLFMGPQVADEAGFLATLLHPATRCNSSVFLALLPHPSEWEHASHTVHFWQLETGQWHRK